MHGPPHSRHSGRGLLAWERWGSGLGGHVPTAAWGPESKLTVSGGSGANMMLATPSGALATGLLSSASLSRIAFVQLGRPDPKSNPRTFCLTFDVT